MSNLSDLLPAGGGQNAEKFTATGTLPSGQAVALKADGTVAAVGPTPISENVGTASAFATPSNTNPFKRINACYDVASGSHVIAYRDEGDSNKGKAVVATPSGSSLSYGTPVGFTTGTTTDIGLVYADSVNKFLLHYKDAADLSKGAVRVGTVSGTSMTFGAKADYGDYDESLGEIAWSPDDNVFVVVWDDDNNTGESRVGTVSGTSISYGTEVSFAPESTNDLGISHLAIGYTTGSKVVVAYRCSSASNQRDSYVRVGTISGTSISWGSRVLLKAGTNGSAWGTKDHSVCYDPISGKVLISYWNESNSDYPEVVVGTISGTSISLGTSVVVNSSGASTPPTMVYNAAAQKVVITYILNSNSTNAFSSLITISGTTPTLSSPLSVVSSPFYQYPADGIGLSYNSVDKNVLLAYGLPSGNGGGGKALIYTAAYTGTNSTDFLGITAEGISNGATGSVNLLGGINEAQSGLTIGSDYYVQDDGSLAAGVTSIPFDISGATYTQSFSVSAQESNPRQIAFNADGTKMFIVGQNGQDVSEYTLSTGFDVSTSAFVDAFDVSPQDIYPQGLAFSTDGTKMFVVGIAGVDVNEYTLSTGFDVSTASFVDSFSISAQGADPKNIAFNTDGTKMFIVELAGQDVNEYTLSSGFDVSTASFVDSFSVASEETQPHGITFNADGTVMFIVGFTGDDVNKYNLSTGFDVSTASFSNITFSVAAEETQPNTIAFSADGSIMFVLGGAGQDVDQYSTTQTTFATTVLAGQAISATTINMRNLT